MVHDWAVVANNISKIYHIYDKPQDRLKQVFFFGRKKIYREFWALKNISLQICKGETIGLIGRNGSGKSTLLQLITGILAPSQGNIAVNGRISALLELGSGFNPELTGRENAYMNGVIMGLESEQIHQRMPMIEQFAEIGEFMDQPVKLYSSGMFVRLAFACAIHVDPDILIVDEALAVGDMHFQLKCMERMKAFKRDGKTILFVSHDVYSIRNFCERAIWLKDGQVYRDGDVNTVVAEYEDYMTGGQAAVNASEAIVTPPTGQVVTIHTVKIMDENGNPRCDFAIGQSLQVLVDYTLHKHLQGLVGGVAIYNQQNTYICGLNTKLDSYPLPEEPGRYTLCIQYHDMPLLPGTYHLDAGFFESAAVVNLDYKSRSESFRIHANGQYIAEGLTYIKHQWQMKKSETQ